MVVAIRQSGAAFTGMYNVRSTTFDEYLLLHDKWTAQLGELQQHLADALYAAVPRQPTGAARAVLLKAKRNVWNARPIPQLNESKIDEETLAQVAEYNSVVKALSENLVSLSPVIVEEIRSGVRALTKEPRFRSAVNYACPWLIDAYERRSIQPVDELLNEERGIFSYAVKFFSKANPLHLFATVGLIQNPRRTNTGSCEIVVNTGFVLELERAAISAITDPYRRFVSLSCHLDEGRVWRFLTRNGRKCQTVSIKPSAKLARLAAFLDAPVPRSLGDCLDDLLDHADGTREELSRFLNGLLRYNVLTEFLVWDFRRFAEQLNGSDPELEEPLQFFRDIHLKPLPESCLSAIEPKLNRIDLPAVGTPTYYVNSYNTAAPPPRDILDPIANDLRNLKPFFTAMPNTAVRARDLTSVVFRHLDRCPNGRAPYLTLLYECLRHADIPPVEGEKSVQSRPAESEELDKWVTTLSALEGQVTASDLNAFQPAIGTRDTWGVCFNGPINELSGMFFPTNSFSGEGRFVSRYLLGEAPCSCRRVRHREQDDEVMDVQLVLPLDDNRMFVRSLYPVGCGFERRYRYDFEQWIDPAEITVERHKDSVRYRHTATQRLMRIHYLGFFRSEFLTPEYGLLLLNHADSYTNPFSALPAAKQNTTSFGTTYHVPALLYGKICLRREEFKVPRSILQKLLEGTDFLATSIRFRDSLHCITGTRTEQWYFRTARVGKAGFKPRYLDLRNPVSVQILSREVAALEEAALVSFSRMDPPIEHLPLQDSHRYTTEFMIEV
jgi:hypothetical protein